MLDHVDDKMFLNTNAQILPDLYMHLPYWSTMINIYWKCSVEMNIDLNFCYIMYYDY